MHTTSSPLVQKPTACVETVKKIELTISKTDLFSLVLAHAVQQLPELKGYHNLTVNIWDHNEQTAPSSDIRCTVTGVVTTKELINPAREPSSASAKPPPAKPHMVM
jgi:hypothetical protein